MHTMSYFLLLTHALENCTIPLASKLKENIISRFNKPDEHPIKDNTKNFSLLRLRIVLLRKLNKLLEKNIDETPQEVSNIRNAITELDTKLKYSASPLNIPIEISQSPLLQSNKAFTCDLAEITSRNNSDEEIESSDFSEISKEVTIVKEGKMKLRMKGTIKKVKMKNKENVNLNNITNALKGFDRELTKVQIDEV